MDTLNIILVDDHELYRVGIRTAITGTSGFKVNIQAEAESGADFFALLAAQPLPQMVLLDIILPDVSGVEIARRLKEEHPAIKIIMLSSEVSEELITELLDIGVDGYLCKLAKSKDIQRAIATVAGGMSYYGRSVARLMFDIYMKQRHGEHGAKKKKMPKTKLTDKEKEVIKLLSDGLTIKEVADRLRISPRTVNSYKSTILTKLGFSHTVDLIKYAVKEGLAEV